jgi:Beta-propeller repeat
MRFLRFRLGYFGLLAWAALAALALASFRTPLQDRGAAPRGRADIQRQATQSRLVQSYGKLPLSFEANRGQTDSQVKFLSRGSGYTLFLTRDEAVLALRGSDPRGGAAPAAHQPSAAGSEVQRSINESTTNALLRMKLVKANPAAKVTGVDELPGKSNYFIGNDPKKWRSNVPAYEKVRYEGIYPGVDLLYYGNQRQLEYDFVVAPGADPRRIQFDVRGAEHLSQDERGDLVLQAGTGEVRWHKPVVYQEEDGKRHQIDGRYVIRDGPRVGFDVAGYNTNKPLIVDPALVYSTYLGGTNADLATGIAVDSSGNAYVTGWTGSTDFPTVNPLQAAYGCCYDAFVSKINSTGSALVYSTYLGGSNGDFGAKIAVDGSGNACVTGYTDSTNFPTVNPLQAANRGSFDAFVAKINSTGSALVYSSYLGGSGDDFGVGIAVDSSGNAYITGQTDSTDFPTVNPLQAANGGSLDTFVAKINSTGSALFYSTYLGGSDFDFGYGIAVDNSGNAYITGITYSTDFPTLNPLQAAYGGGIEDAFVAKINSTGSALVYSTYLGGSDRDYGYGITVDNSGNAYITGTTWSTDFPTVNPLQAAHGGGIEDAFVAKINSAGSALVYSTYLGGSSFDDGLRIAVDSSGNAYITGSTWSTDFPTVNPLQKNYGGGVYDAFVAEINPTGSALVYSTYLGGSDSDYGYDITVDSSGNAYITGVTLSTDFPTVNPLQKNSAGGGEEGFVAKIASVNYKASVQQPINADGSSIFQANRGVVPVKFTLAVDGAPTCTLPPATISVTRTAGGVIGSVDESAYSMAADSGSSLRIDPTACQYLYNLATSSLGAGAYRVDISIEGMVVGDAVFALK